MNDKSQYVGNTMGASNSQGPSTPKWSKDWQFQLAKQFEGTRWDI
jgi:hypothetical protein